MSCVVAGSGPVAAPLASASGRGRAVAVEAARQHVEKEAADELAGRERHRLDPGLARRLAAGAIVLPAEGDALVAEADQARIRDRDAMGVARQVGEDGLWPGER